MNDLQLKGGLYALCGALLFATKAIFVKLAYRYGVDSSSLLMLRMLFSLPFFIAIGCYGLQQNSGALEIINRYKWRIIAYGMIGYYVASLFDLEALQYIDASLERIILFSYPILVLLFSMISGIERPNKMQVSAIVITYLGIILAFQSNLDINDPGTVYKGGILVFIAAITYAIYLVGTGHLASRIGSRLYNSFAMTAAAVAVIIHNSILNGFNLLTFQSEVYYYAILISIFSTVIPSYLIVAGIRKIGANNTSIIGSIGPIATILMAIVILNEKILLNQWIGTGLVIVGVLLVISMKPAETELDL